MRDPLVQQLDRLGAELGRGAPAKMPSAVVDAVRAAAARALLLKIALGTLAACVAALVVGWAALSLAGGGGASAGAGTGSTAGSAPGPGAGASSGRHDDQPAPNGRRTQGDLLSAARQMLEAGPMTWMDLSRANRGRSAEELILPTVGIGESAQGSPIAGRDDEVSTPLDAHRSRPRPRTPGASPDR